MALKRNSIREKYSLSEGELIDNAWKTQTVDCSDTPQIVMDVEQICSLGVDNINDNCKLASDLRVLGQLRGYKSQLPTTLKGGGL